MKCLVYHGNKDLRLESASDPVPGPGEVKIRVDYCGICATDIEEYLYGPTFIAGDTPNPLTGKTLPTITGHEITGTVVESADDVEDVAGGTRVALNTVLTCGKCRWCQSGRTMQCPSMAVAGFDRDGGLAEFMVWPASQVVPLPANVTSRQAALVEPASVAYHAVNRSGLERGDSLVVLGAGTVGMLALQIAKARGARVIAVDRRQMSLYLAAELGADATINGDETDVGEALRDLTGGLGPDVVLDAAGGSATTASAVEWVRRGGRVVLVAIYVATPEFDFNSLVGAEKELVGTIAFGREDVEAVIGLISSGAVRTTPLISEVISLDEVIDVGFARMMAPTKDIFRILVAPSGEPD